VACWGNGGDGQLGYGGYSFSSTPKQAGSLSDAARVVTGGAHVCAILGAAATGGTLECWGASYTGQVGDGGYNNRSAPAPIAGIAGVVDVTAGDEHTCALLADKTVMCWGDDRGGQLGDGIAARATPVAPLLPCP
jgi:hypothetical protein